MLLLDELVGGVALCGDDGSGDGDEVGADDAGALGGVTQRDCSAEAG